MFSRILIAAISLGVTASPVIAAGYSIENTDPFTFNFSRTDSVGVKVNASSAAALKSTVVRLNGAAVTKLLQPDSSGALAGRITGLREGDNTLQVFASASAKTAAASLTINRGTGPKISCAAMSGKTIPASAIALPTNGAAIKSATLIPASGQVPEYCALVGAISPVDKTAPDINFQVSIPTLWNGKSWHSGGGGTNGTIPAVVANPGRGGVFGINPPTAPPLLAEGYALYGSDSGHSAGRGGGPPGRGPGGPNPGAPGGPQGGSGRGPGGGRGFQQDPAAIAAASAWITNEESWRNFAFEQLKKTHDAAMQVFIVMYGAKPKVSYFAGESQGGREGLEALSRYPDDYDGVLSRVPLAYFAGLLFDPTVKGVTQLPPGTWVPPAKSAAIGAEVLRLCDVLDGLADGVINNYVACNRLLDPDVTPNPLAHIRCPNGEDTGNDCLSDKQIATVSSFRASEHFGYKLANGETDWPGWGTGLESPGSGGFGGGWLLSNSKPDLANPGAFNAGIGAAVQKGRFGGSQDFNLLTFNFAGLQKQIQALSDLLDVRDDWSGFFRRKGRLIMITAASDYISNPRAQMRLYERVAARSGQSVVDQSVRYYVSPNTGHGGSGNSAAGVPVPNAEDTMLHLQNWVENGIAPPDSVVQTRYDRQAPYAAQASRPMCRYPLYPRYNGSGDPNSAQSYTCARP
jgi:feruloyl esterase